MYIALEGLPGCGKSTQLQKIKEYLATIYPAEEFTYVYEPGGTEIADAIRALVQATPFQENMDPLCEAYLYAASRAQLLNTKVLGELNKGKHVISDRSFVSSLAFQGSGRKLSFDEVININLPAINRCIFDKLIYFVLPAEVSYSRMNDHGGDKFESLPLEFFEEVEAGYNSALELPLIKDKVVKVDATGTIDEVFSNLLATQVLTF